MALPASGALSLGQIQTEFGGENPISMSEYYRNGPYTTSNNTNVPTSGTIFISQFYGATAFVADVTPNAVNWANISGVEIGSNANQTISGINQTITLNRLITGFGSLQYSLNNGGWVDFASTVNVSNGQTLRFQVIGIGAASGTVTIRNQSSGNVTLDTFDYEIFASEGGGLPFP